MRNETEGIEAIVYFFMESEAEFFEGSIRYPALIPRQCSKSFWAFIRLVGVLT